MSYLVTFSGLDGAGKTTQISRLVEHLERRSMTFTRLTMYDQVSVAARVRRSLGRSHPSARSGAGAASARASGSGDGSDLRFDKNRADLPTVLARKLVYLLDLAHFLLIRRRLAKQGGVMVMDRYFYDSLANLLVAGRWTYPYVATFLRLAPAPDLAVLLDLEPETAFARKREYPLDYLRARRDAYLRIFDRVEGALVLDGEQDPTWIGERIAQQADSLIAGSDLEAS